MPDEIEVDWPTGEDLREAALGLLALDEKNVTTGAYEEMLAGLGVDWEFASQAAFAHVSEMVEKLDVEVTPAVVLAEGFLDGISVGRAAERQQQLAEALDLLEDPPVRPAVKDLCREMEAAPDLVLRRRAGAHGAGTIASIVAQLDRALKGVEDEGASYALLLLVDQEIDSRMKKLYYADQEEEPNV